MRHKPSSPRRSTVEEMKIACLFIMSLCLRRFASPNKGSHKFAIHILPECGQRITCSSRLIGVEGFARAYLGEHIHVDFETLFSHQ